jgi:CBS domain-containing protein
MTLGDTIIFTVTATTLCVQLIGPAFAKLAIEKAGEAGRNVTEEDVMGEWTVQRVVSSEVRPLKEGTLLSEVVRHFAEQDTFVYPVVSAEDQILGVLTFDMLKELLNDRDTWQWLVVGDVMQPVGERVLAGANLAEALQDMQNMQAEVLPVVESLESNRLVGVLDVRNARRQVGAELVRRQTTNR